MTTTTFSAPVSTSKDWRTAIGASVIGLFCSQRYARFANPFISRPASFFASVLVELRWVFVFTARLAALLPVYPSPMMQRCMFAARHHLKIFKSVVQPIAVFVMDATTFWNWPKRALPNVAVFKYESSPFIEHPITVSSNPSATIDFSRRERVASSSPSSVMHSAIPFAAVFFAATFNRTNCHSAVLYLSAFGDQEKR